MKKWIQTGCLLVFAGILFFLSSNGTIKQEAAIEVSEPLMPEAVDFVTESEIGEEELAPSEAPLAEAMTTLATMNEPESDREVLEEGNLSQEESTEPEESEMPQDEEDSEYADFAISNVSGYVNVREEPSKDSRILGKMYHGAVAQIQETAGEDGEWFHILSGSVDGYIKAEYFIYGNDAVEIIDEYITHYAVAQVDRLRVRKEPSTDAGKMGYLDKNEKAVMVADLGDWIQIEYSNGKTGYVSAEYVFLEEQFDTAISLEEERAEKERQEALAARQRAEEEKNRNSVEEEGTEVSEGQGEYQPANTEYGSNAELRQQILDFAMQYLGNKYIHGGNSLEGGTDCSGFTSLIYKEFGYSLSRTPGGQLSSAGRSVDISEIQIGDVVCYGKKGGKCTHVALYAGNDQIIHSSTPKGGVKMGNLYYDTILGIKNVID